MKTIEEIENEKTIAQTTATALAFGVCLALMLFGFLMSETKTTAMEIKTQIITFFYNCLVMWITGTLSLLTYSYRSTGSEFNFYCWFATNKTRFSVGALMILGIALIQTLAPEGIGDLLAVFGFNPQATPVALGLGIGTILIAAVSGNKAKTADNL